MNIELKTKWVEALRSGRYHQARSALIEAPYDDQPARFCCLGVLCDASGALWEDIDSEHGTLDGKLIRSKSGSFLSPEILDFVGFDDLTQKKLAHMNDDGKTFAEIAEYIETSL